MVTNVPALDAVYSALGDSTRRAILTRLADREHTVGELAGAGLIYRLMLADEPLDTGFVDRLLNEALLPLLKR